jgi:hypothetical protein
MKWYRGAKIIAGTCATGKTICGDFTITDAARAGDSRAVEVMACKVLAQANNLLPSIVKKDDQQRGPKQK